MPASVSLTIPEAAQVAEVSSIQLRRWLESFEDDAPGHVPRTGRGADAFISRRTIVQVTVAARLVELGVGVRTALDAGLEFAHVGDDDRGPCEEFSQGSTWLISNPVQTRIVMIGDGLGDSNPDAYDRIEDALAVDEKHERCAHAVLNLTRFVAEIDERIAWVLRTMRPRNTRLRGATEVRE